jgi:hypothetical protein
LGDLYKGLGISKLQFFSKIYKFFQLQFFQFLVIKTLDLNLDLDLTLDLDLDPHPDPH